MRSLGEIFGKLLLLLLFFTTILSLFLFIPGSATLLNVLTSLALIVPPLILYYSFHESRKFSFEVLEKHFYRHFLIGFLISSGVLILIFSLACYLGLYRINDFSFLKAAKPLASSLLFYLLLAFGQEFFVRGYIYNLIKAETSRSAAALISALIFVGVYRFDPDLLGKIIPLAIIFELGLVLALLYELTNSLWTSVGFHLSWLFLQDSIFGIGILAASNDFGLFHITIKKPYSNAAYGLEGNLITIVCLAILLIILISLVWRKKSYSKINVKYTQINWYNKHFMQ